MARSGARVLLLASDRDVTARALCDDLDAAGLSTSWWSWPPRSPCRVRAGYGGSLPPEVSSAGLGAITGIVHRGLGAEGERQDFALDEWIATWWCVLATFGGRVVNRPAIDRPILTFDPAARPRGDAPPPSVRTLLSSPGSIRPAAPEVAHCYEPDTGAFLGRITASGAPVPADDLCLIRVFDPARVAHFLYAGDRIFDLLSDDGEPLADDGAALASIACHLAPADVPFCHVVVERQRGAAPRFKLVTINTFPALAHYQHIQARVHRALADGLRR